MILEAFLKLPASYWLILGGIFAVGIAAAALRPNKRKNRRGWGRKSFLQSSQASDNSDPWQHAGPDQVPNWKKDADSKPPRPTVDTSRWSLELLQTMEWHRFELLCAAYFEALGFRAELTKFGPDGGVDIHLYAPGQNRPSIIVQCKAWKSEPVGVNLVREHYGVMARNKVPEGIFVTTGTYTPDALAFPTGNDFHLIDGRDFLKKLLALTEAQQSDLLKKATEGDFTTPTCASCGIKLVWRTPQRNGTPFWGCRNFPRCRQTLQQTAS